jgi:hypothetical protein
MSERTKDELRSMDANKKGPDTHKRFGVAASTRQGPTSSISDGFAGPVSDNELRGGLDVAGWGVSPTKTGEQRAQHRPARRVRDGDDTRIVLR